MTRTPRTGRRRSLVRPVAAALTAAGLALTGAATATALTPALTATVEPVAVNDHAQVASPTATLVRVLANDTLPDGQAATVTITDGPARGTATVQDGLVKYQPAAPYYMGYDALTYQVCVSGGCDTATLGLSIGLGASAPPASEWKLGYGKQSVAVNVPTDCPTDVSDYWDCASDGTTQFVPSFMGFGSFKSATHVSDTAGTLTVVDLDDPDHPGSQALRYTPHLPAGVTHLRDTWQVAYCLDVSEAGLERVSSGCGVTEFTFSVSRTTPLPADVENGPDGNHDPLPGFRFVPVVQADIPDGDVPRLIEWDVNNGVISAQAASPTTAKLDPATVKVLENAQAGRVVTTGDGALTYIPTQVGMYSDAIVYQACDVNGVCQTRAASVKVRADAFGAGPDVLAEPDTLTVPSGATATVPVLDNDLWNGQQEVSIVDAPAHGTATIGKNGTLSFTAARAGTPTPAGTLDELAYRLCANNVCAETTVKVTVGKAAATTPVPPAPKPTPTPVPTKPTPKPVPTSPKPATPVVAKPSAPAKPVTPVVTKPVTPKPVTPVVSTPAKPARPALPDAGGDLSVLALIGGGLLTAAGAATFALRGRRRD